MKQEPKQINYDSPEAASIQTVTGWVSASGRFWGKDEHMARWDGCTHILCSGCRKPIPKNGFTVCDECRAKSDDEMFAKRDRVEWNLKFPIYSNSRDEYYFDLDSLTDVMHDEVLSVEDLQLMPCEPNYPREIDIDHWCDDLPEDGELPPDMQDALDSLNRAIRQSGPLSWSPAKTALDVESVKNVIENEDSRNDHETDWNL